jgi:hypothetical protein
MANRYWVGGTGTWDETAGTKWSDTSALVFTASCSGTALTTVGSPALVVGMTVFSNTYVSLGTIVSGSSNSWVVSVGGTFASQTMSAATVGASVPTTSDDVFFDANSRTITITRSGSGNCKSFTCTGFTGTFNDTVDGFTIAGGFTLSAGMSVNLTRVWNITGSGTLISAGKALPSIRINASGITVDQGDAFTFNTGFTALFNCLQIIAGTYNTNNYNITHNSSVGNGISVAGNSVRALNLGSSNITITYPGNSSNNGSYFNASTTTNLTFNAGTSTYTCVSTNPTIPIPSFDGGGLTFYNVVFTANSSGTTTSGVTIGHSLTGANTFNNLTVNPRTSTGMGFFFLGGNQTVNGTFSFPGNASASARMTLKSDTTGTTRTLTCAAVSLVDVDFQDITGAGAAAPLTGTRLGDAKGNSGITFPAGVNKYWNLAAGGNFGGAASWATTSGGTALDSNFPLPQDTVVFENTGLNTSATVTINSSYSIGTLNMSSRSSAMTLAIDQITPVFVGDWINSTGITFSGTSVLNFSGRNTQQITSAGRTFTQRFNINSPSGTVTLQDAFITSVALAGAVTLTNGTLNLDGKTLTLSATATATFLTAAGTKNLTFNGSTLVIAASGTTAFNNAAPTGFTTTAGTGTGTISFTSASAKTFVGGGSTYNCTLNQGGAGALTITGSSAFDNITNTRNAVSATSILFTAGTTNTFANWNANGAATRLLTIGSPTAASHTLSKASGTVSADYLSISRSTATGDAAWYAGVNSVDGGNNTGWVFSGPPTGSFFLFFN